MARMSSRRKERSFVKAWDGSCFKLQLRVADTTLTANGATPTRNTGECYVVTQSTCTLLRNSEFSQLYLGGVDESMRRKTVLALYVVCFYSRLQMAYIDLAQHLDPFFGIIHSTVQLSNTWRRRWDTLTALIWYQ